VGRVALPEAGWDQVLYGLSQEFLAGVPEELFHARIGLEYAAVLIRHNHGIGGRDKEVLEDYSAGELNR
jgi:hypothetical protein